MRVLMWVECGDGYAINPGQNGSAHSVSSEPADEDIVKQLRDIATEVTGRDFATPQKKMGFY